MNYDIFLICLEPVPIKPVHNPFAVERPHAAANLLQRQGSLRGGPLNHASPFKRQLSLRMGIDLPTSVNSIATDSVSANANSTSSSASTSQRDRAHSVDLTGRLENSNTTTPVRRNVPNSLFSLTNKVTLAPSGMYLFLFSNNSNTYRIFIVAPIEEVSPSLDQPNTSILTQGTSSNDESSMIAAMCQELSQGLSILAAKTDDDIAATHRALATTSPGHFSPPAALGISSKEGTTASFSAFGMTIF